MFGMVTALVVQEPSAVRATPAESPVVTAARAAGSTALDLPGPGHRLMRLVTAAEAVAGIRSGEQVYVHCAAAAPSVLLDALVARARSCATSG